MQDPPLCSLHALDELAQREDGVTEKFGRFLVWGALPASVAEEQPPTGLDDLGCCRQCRRSTAPGMRRTDADDSVGGLLPRVG